MLQGIEHCSISHNMDWMESPIASHPVNNIVNIYLLLILHCEATCKHVASGANSLFKMLETGGGGNNIYNV